LRKRASEVDAKLKRLYDAIENGVTDLSDLMLRDRIAELKAIRDQARADGCDGGYACRERIRVIGHSIAKLTLSTKH
jgi:hypothetical protein